MRILKRYAFVLCLLLPIPALATHAGGDNGGEIWVDGPADVQPGVGPNRADATIDNLGRSIYVWATFISTSNRNDVYLRHFDAAGNPLTDPIQVNTLTDDDQFFPRVAVSADNSSLSCGRATN